MSRTVVETAGILLPSSPIDTVAEKKEEKDLDTEESGACQDVIRNGLNGESASVPSASVNSHSTEKQGVAAELRDPLENFDDILLNGLMNSLTEVGGGRHVPEEHGRNYLNKVVPCDDSDLSNGILPLHQVTPESVLTPSKVEAQTGDVPNVPEIAGKEEKTKNHYEQDLGGTRIFVHPMAETHTIGVPDELELVGKEDNIGDHREHNFCTSRIIDSEASSNYLNYNTVECDMHSGLSVVTAKEEEMARNVMPNGSSISATEEALQKSGKPIVTSSAEESLVKTLISTGPFPPTTLEDGGMSNGDSSVYLVQKRVDDELHKVMMSLNLEEEPNGDHFAQGQVVGFPSTPVPCIQGTLQRQGLGKSNSSFEEEVKHLEEALEKQSETVRCLNGALSIDAVQKSSDTHLDSSKDDAFDEGANAVSVPSKAEGSDSVPDSCHVNLLNPQVDDDYVMVPGSSFGSDDGFNLRRKEVNAKMDTESRAQLGHWAASTERQICEGQSLDKDGGSSMESTAGSGWKVNGRRSPKSVDDANSCDSEDSASSPACAPPFQIRKKIDIHHQFVREIVKIQHDREQYDREQVEKQIQAQTLAHQGLRMTIVNKERKGTGKESTHERCVSMKSGRLNGNGDQRLLHGPHHSSNEGLRSQTKSNFSEPREPSYENNEQDHVSLPYSVHGARQRRNSGQHKQLQFMPIYRPPSARDPLATCVDERRSRDSQSHTSTVVMGSSPDSSASSMSDHHFPSIESPKLAGMGIKVTFDTHKQQRHIKFSEGSDSTNEKKPACLVHSTLQAAKLGRGLVTSPSMRVVHDPSRTLSLETSSTPSRKLERLRTGSDRLSQKGEKKKHTESNAIQDNVLPQLTHCNSPRPQSDANAKQKAAEPFGRDKKRRESRKKSSSKIPLSSHDAQFGTPPKSMSGTPYLVGTDVHESQVGKSTRVKGVEEIHETAQDSSQTLIVGIERTGCKQATQQQPTLYSNDGSSFYTTPLLGKWGDIVDDFPDTYDYDQPSVEMDNHGSFGNASLDAGSYIHNSPVSGGLMGAANLNYGRSASKPSSIDKGSRRHLNNSTLKDKVSARITHMTPLGPRADEPPCRRSVWERLGPRNLSGDSILGPPPKALSDRGALVDKASPGVGSKPELSSYTPHVSYGPRSKHDARRDYKDDI